MREPSGFGKSDEELLLCGVSVSYCPISTELPAWDVTRTFALVEIFRCSDCGITWKLLISASYLIGAPTIGRVHRSSWDLDLLSRHNETLGRQTSSMFAGVKFVGDSFGPRRPRRLYDSGS